MSFRTRTLLLSGFLALFVLITGTGSVHAENIPQDISGLSPYQVLGLYAQAMADRNNDPDLSIYAKDTRKWKKDWSVNNTQMANSERGLKICGKGKLIEGKKLAVIRYSPANRECHPFYFVFEEGAWRMDFLTMMQTIRMNQRNLWHFSRMDHPYMFAFKDWRFDQNGYPHK